ncbi:MAG: C-type lectin domain-containing protein [Deltaproteobacteria bacterium]|nr:C-type lectin domain-containing protein [Deltaproteobacteria bacterium]
MRALVLVLALGGCMRPAAFACASDGECVRGGEQGVCEPVGRCSFSDPTCESGKRFAELSGEHGGACVGETSESDADARVEDPLDTAVPLLDAPVDTPPIEPSVCPGFTLTDGHYWKKLGAAGWTNQRSACGNLPGNVFLAVPDDLAELAAIVAIAGGDAWIGISDAATEADYMTVLGAGATFLPWAPSEPDNAGNQDCVRSKGATIETALCGTPAIAVCECVP